MAIKKLGRYEILSELGQGAMGVVYKAIDPLIERTVAIKTIKLDLSKDELANFEERFYREAKSAGRLNHPNIVTIYDVGKSDDSAYMAMEFMEGQLLRDILDAHTALSIDKIVDIVVQIAEGLAYAHENGIVHRDIKPANIMLVRDGVAKIMDFGIAQMPSGARTLAGAVLGSPKYMAPEQVVGKAVDGRSDLFALGVILYEMLTGESPFDGDNINTIMYRILNVTPVAPKTLAPRTPEAFNHIIGKALAKEPDKRYQYAKEFATDLRNYKKSIASVDTASPEAARTPHPRSNIGVETILLSAYTSGAQPNASAATDKSRTTSIFNALPILPLWRYRKIIIVGLAVLVSVLAITTLLSKKWHHKNNLPTAITEQLPKNAASKPSASSSLSNTTTKTPPTSTTSNASPTQEKRQAHLIFAIRPWGEIYIDGKKAGVTPPVKKLTLPPGKHKIEIRNLNSKPYSETIDLKAGSTKRIKYVFR